MLDIFETLKEIPEWLGAAVCGLMGWFGHTLYLSFKTKLLPYEQDRERFEAIIKAINPDIIEYFYNLDYQDFYVSEAQKLSKTKSQLDYERSHQKICLKKDLREKEEQVFNHIRNLQEIISYKSYYKAKTMQVRTICWDAYDSNNLEDVKKIDSINKEINQISSALKASYKDYKEYGEGLFARRIKK